MSITKTPASMIDPSGATNGQVLTFNGSTSVWVASSLSVNKIYYNPTEYFIIGYNGGTGVLNDNYADNTWRDIKTMTVSSWSTYFGTKPPKNITVCIYSNELGVEATIGNSVNFISYAGLDFATISANKYFIESLNYSGDNSTSINTKKIYFNENGTAYLKFIKTDPPSWFMSMLLLEAEF